MEADPPVDGVAAAPDVWRALGVQAGLHVVVTGSDPPRPDECAPATGPPRGSTVCKQRTRPAMSRAKAGRSVTHRGGRRLTLAASGTPTTAGGNRSSSSDSDGLGDGQRQARGEDVQLPLLLGHGRHVGLVRGEPGGEGSASDELLSQPSRGHGRHLQPGAARELLAEQVGEGGTGTEARLIWVFPCMSTLDREATPSRQRPGLRRSRMGTSRADAVEAEAEMFACAVPAAAGGMSGAHCARRCSAHRH